VEGIRGVAAVGRRIGQGFDDVQELDHGAGPAVCEDQRQCAVFGGAHMQEVDGLAVDDDRVLRVSVQARLPGAPVIAVAPVPNQVLDIIKTDPVAVAGCGIGPPHPGQPLSQVVKLGLGNVHLETFDVRHAATLACPR
jgi:hypothetical protein